MTIEEYIQKLRDASREIDAGKPLFLASSSATAEMITRVFVKGQNETGDTFQYNSTDPLYVNPVTSPGKKFPTKGKTGSDTFKSGKKAGQKHKTGWFENYKSYRDTIGRPTDKVNFDLSGDLRSSISNGLRRVNNNEYVLEIKRPNDVKKRSGLDERYDNVFGINKAEEALFQRVYADEIIKLARA